MPKHTRAARRQTIQSNTYRFFVDSGAIHGRDVLLEDGELAHQIGTVLRLRPGEKITLLDNSGWQHVVALHTVERGRVAGTVRAQGAGRRRAAHQNHAVYRTHAARALRMGAPEGN